MVVEPQPESEPAGGFRVVWSRGRGCAALAELLGGSTAVKASGDLAAACVETRADLVVSRKLLPSFDLVSLAVPVDLATSGFGSVVAAVAGGPHSALAARVASALGRAAAVPASMVCAYRGDEGEPNARAWVERVLRAAPGLEWKTVQVDSVGDLIAEVPGDAAMVIGAPGGTWFQRLFFGAGARLRQAAPNGVVVVRSVPARVFQVMEEPVYVSPHMGRDDALALTADGVLPVVEGGRLVGVASRSALLAAGPGASVDSVMQPAVAVEATDPASSADQAGRDLGGDLVPVVDREGGLLGVVRLRR